MKPSLVKKYLAAVCIIMLLCKILFPLQYPFILVVFMLFTFPVCGLYALAGQYALSGYIEENYPAQYKARKFHNGLIDGSFIKYSKDPAIQNDEELHALLKSLDELQYLTGLSFALIIVFALIIYL